MGWGVEGFGFLGGIGGERGHWVMGKFGRKGGGMDPRLDPRHTDTDWVLKWVGVPMIIVTSDFIEIALLLIAIGYCL